MICSILIPTRSRLSRLKETLQSIQDTANQANYEIILRLDSDDKETILGLNDLNKQFTFKAIIGPRLLGYSSINVFYSQMAEAATGTWIFILNDDCILEGKGWDEQLSKLKPNCIVQSEYNKLGPSLYVRNEGGPFPIVPRNCWKKFGHEVIPNPVDTELDQLLRVRNKWPTVFLKGLIICHNRQQDETLSPDRL